MNADAAAAAPFCGAALLPAGAPLPPPWLTEDSRSLDCELCGDVVAELWPLDWYPADLDWGLSPALCVCRRCAEAIRPAATAHRSVA
jgi:hypothetical protein